VTAAAKIIVVGATGLVGAKVVDILNANGLQVLAASRRSGVDLLTGDGLADALGDTQVVVDVTDSPSYEDDALMDFFTTATGNLCAAERAAGVAHHVALSVVGADRMPGSGYMRAKVAQESRIAESGVPYTILRATQFFEFARGIADACADGNTVRLPEALIQPLAATEVAAKLSPTPTPTRPGHGSVSLTGLPADNAGYESAKFTSLVTAFHSSIDADVAAILSRIALSTSRPSNSRNGGSSSSVTISTASATLRGSPGR
jgi:uncharacterized protein YbjT (DUF2867 family)